MTSADGITWTSQTAPVNNNWRAVEYGGPVGQKRFVAVSFTGTGNRVMTSEDAVAPTTTQAATASSTTTIAVSTSPAAAPATTVPTPASANATDKELPATGTQPIFLLILGVICVLIGKSGSISRRLSK